MISLNTMNVTFLGKQLLRYATWLIAVALLMVPSVAIVSAQSSSSNYRVEESFIGPGGLLNSSSSSFQARASLGDTGIGNSASSNFQIFAGFTTTDEPYLEFSVSGVTTDLGVLSPGTAATTSAQFYVRTYLAQGYQVTTVSDPPTSGTEQLDPLTTPTASSPGTEQFGINLVANTAPAVVGADPLQIPDASFSFGYAAANYDTANLYTYNKDDIIAASDSSTGQTTYTISYLFNIAPFTPAGQYRIDHTLVATSTF
jgi:hypothetical protein